MATTITKVVEAVHAHKNIVINSVFGVGAVNNTLHSLSTAGFSTATLGFPGAADPSGDSPLYSGSTFSDTLFIDLGAHDSLSQAEITELMENRSFRGQALPGLKSVVLVRPAFSIAEAEDATRAFAELPNTEVLTIQ